MITVREGKSLNTTKPVKVYRNLNNGQLSVMQNQIVIGYAEELNLKDVTFHVQKAGLEKVRREKVKNVHAYVKGYLSEGDVSGFKIKYNPMKYDSFVDENEVPIHSVSKIHINNKGEMIGE